jgi:hypothetical protein
MHLSPLTPAASPRCRPFRAQRQRQSDLCRWSNRPKLTASWPLAGWGGLHPHATGKRCRNKCAALRCEAYQLPNRRVTGTIGESDMKPYLFACIGSLALFTGGAAQAAMCPDGSYVAGNTCQLAPNGSYVSGGGLPQLAPNGSYVGGGGMPRLAPNGTYVGGSGSLTMCPDGSYVAGSCHLQPNGRYTGN